MYSMFEKDDDALRQALTDTEERIRKLEEHKEVEAKRLENANDETINRLERNLDKLRKKRESIIQELEN